jgi:hypothetical protein
LPPDSLADLAAGVLEITDLGDLHGVAEALSHHAAQEAAGNGVVFDDENFDGHGAGQAAAVVSTAECSAPPPRSLSLSPCTKPPVQASRIGKN